ncbi:unnamed protein product [Urochloa decumbens]|uniref:Uncharacterized protein n=1 Tax=Urochloa decumbens TaxID=240449 RepID=A0ABC9C241_9POAL
MEDQQEQSSGDPHAVVVDITSFAQAMEQELAERHQHHGDGSVPCTPTIAMVHDLTRNVDEQEYDPHYVSIGPYHRKTTRKDIIREDDKLTSLYTILSRSSPGTTVQKYIDGLAPLEGRARSFYAHRFSEMNSFVFLRMLLLDACYLLHCFVNFNPQNSSSAANEQVMMSSPAPEAGDANIVREHGSPAANGHAHAQGGDQETSTASAAGGGNKLEDGWVVRDVLYLAENQIPYFVIDKIHNLAFSGSQDPQPPVKTIAQYISSILQKQQYSMVELDDDAPPPGNLLHLLHMHFPEPKYAASPPRIGETVGRCRTAMEYHINGVNFKCCTISAIGKARCILDLTLDRASGTLVVPRLNIDANTWCILRNLMALEQLNPALGCHVTAYCSFMSQLACTTADVELLSRRGVIEHRLGNNGEVAALFSNLCKGIEFDPDDPGINYLRATCQALDELYRSRPRRWMALLVQKYSKNPWLAVGVMAGAFGLLCAIVQAVYSVLSYFQGAAK